MNLHKSSFHPMLRAVAAATLGAWLVSQIVCFVHCTYDGKSSTAQPSCHASANKPCHSAGNTPTKPSSSSGMSCVSFAKILLSQSEAIVSPPELHVIYFIASMLSNEPNPIPAELAIPREHRPLKWALTPEMSLGPAFYSLAPPASV
jgi:hypothetical protein